MLHAESSSAVASCNLIENTDVLIKKCSGKKVLFKDYKIINAVRSCLMNSCGFIESQAAEIAQSVYTKIRAKLFDHGTPCVEEIQDLVETTLMDIGQYEAAKQYILYRDERRRIREQSSIFCKRVAFRPFEFPDILAFKTAINHSYWLVSEWNFLGDIQDFRTKLNDHERQVLKHTLLAISQIEVSVKRFWARLGERFPKSEFEQVGITFAESEVRHADAYSHLLQVLGLDNAFDEVLKVPAIKGRVDYLTEAMAGMVSESDEDYLLTFTLFCLFVENVSLFSQFAIAKSFNKYKTVLKDVDNVIQATQQEEKIHAMLGITIINHVKKERPNWFGSVFFKKIDAMALRAFEAESGIIDWIFGEQELAFVSKASLKEFIKKRLNDSIESIGGKGPFSIDYAALEGLRWFIEEIDAEINTDFFYKRPVTYSKKTQAITAESIF